MVKYFSLFSGVGAIEKALTRQKIDYEMVGFSEIDKYASKNYSLIHNIPENLNYGDITKINVNTLPDFDLMTWGFPCQDVSVAGNGEGIQLGNRSGLYHEGYRILKAKLPKISIIENVKGLIGKKHIHAFKMILSNLESLGYTNYWKVLNAKDYGIPQNRERVFIVSILGEHKPFNFPEKQELKLKLKDMLENEVDEKYYIAEDKFKNLILNLDKRIVGNVNPSEKGMNGNVYNSEMTSPTITTNKGEGAKVLIQVDIPQIVKVRKHKVDIEKLKLLLKSHKNIRNKEISEKLNVKITTVEHWFRNDNSFSIPDPEIWFKLKKLLKIETSEFDESIAEFEEREGVFEKSNRVYSGEGIAPTLTTSDNTKIIQVGMLDISGKDEIRRVYSGEGISPTLNTMQGGNRQPKVIEGTHLNYRVRKLTPIECWRLMGFDDEDYYKVRSITSNRQLYKQAGNSIVVNVLEKIIEELVKSVRL